MRRRTGARQGMGFSVVGRPLLALPRCVPLLHGGGRGVWEGSGAVVQSQSQDSLPHRLLPATTPAPACCRAPHLVVKGLQRRRFRGGRGGERGAATSGAGWALRTALCGAPPRRHHPRHAGRNACSRPPCPPTPPHPLRCGTNSSTHPLVNQVLVLLQVGRGADEQDAKHRHVQQHLAKEAVLLVQQADACGRAGERGVPCTGPLLPFPCRPPV